jgi:tetratricopeptide (TPR) repeat protein
MSSTDPGPGVWLKAALMCLAAAMPAARAADAPGMPDFEAGVASYRSGDYAQALAAFLAARAAGLDIANLHVDLGLTYYKLGRYAEARSAFERVRQFPDYVAIADFHLGLIAARLGEDARAAELWRSVERGPEGPARDRADIALDRLGRVPPPSAYLLLAAGRDSNPALLDESIQPAGGSESTDVELFGAFDYPLAGDATAATVVRAGGYLRDYFADNGLDQRGLFAGVSRERVTASRRREFFLDASATYLDGERFVDTFTAGVQGIPARRASGLALRGQLSRLAAAGSYRHLEGWRLRAETELTGKPGPARMRAGYQFEINDRADLEAGNEFFSHSPLRHRLTLALDHPVAERWLLHWSLRYRDSRYRDPNRVMEGATLREERRVEELVQAGLQLRRWLGAASNWLLEYQYSHNASTTDAFDYQRHVVLTGIEWMPRGD